MGARENIARLLMGKPGGPTPEGIRVYHSSPHDFDKFDLSKLRTGEGANVYGSGFYFAENPAVSGQGGQYWNQFTGKFGGAEGKAASLLSQAEFDREKALRFAIREAELAREMPLTNMFTEEAKRSHIAQMDKTVQVLQGNAPVGPRTYEVNFKAKPEELLDWDKPINQQALVSEALAGSRSPLVRDVLGRSGAGGSTGENLYKMLSHDTGLWQKGAGASRELNEAGIPGIRYLDQASRVLPSAADRARAQQFMRDAENFGDPVTVARAQKALTEIEAKPPQTHNYVAFDPHKLDIMAKYGLPFAAGATGLGAVADQSAYAAQPDTFDQRWGQQ